jgi:hypothetical protein
MLFTGRQRTLLLACFVMHPIHNPLPLVVQLRSNVADNRTAETALHETGVPMRRILEGNNLSNAKRAGRNHCVAGGLHVAEPGGDERGVTLLVRYEQELV